MTDDAGSGPMQPADTTSEFNVMSFIIEQALAQVRTMVLVKVLKVSNDGGVTPVGTVDVQPLVNFLDGSGVATPHGPLTGLPYTRIQGGANAIILDPEVDDIGWAAISDRDISSIKATKDQANPGSARTFDLMDGVYIGGILNGTPRQYVRFTDNLIELVSPTKLRLQAPTIELVGEVDITGNSNITGNLLVSGSGVVTGSWSVGGALSAASAIISGAFAAASAAITGALSAASGAFTGALTSSTVQATTTVKSDAGAHSLGTHSHSVISGPGAGGGTGGPIG